MDNVSVLEYSIMSDIYDDIMDGSAANESFDYFDEFFGSYEAHDSEYAGATEAAAPGKRFGKVIGFLRAVLKGIAAFFKKMGIFITTWAKNKTDAKRQMQNVELRRIVDTAAGRLKDCMNFVKKKTIVFAEKINSIKFNTVTSLADNFEKFSASFDPLIQDVEARTDDVVAIQEKFEQDWNRTMSKSADWKGNPTDDFKVSDHVRARAESEKRAGDVKVNSHSGLLAQWLRNNYQSDCMALGNAYVQVSDSLDRISNFNDYQQGKVNNIYDRAAAAAGGIGALDHDKIRSVKTDNEDDKIDFNLGEQSRELTEKTKHMESAVAKFNRTVLLSTYYKESVLKSGLQD